MTDAVIFCIMEEVVFLNEKKRALIIKISKIAAIVLAAALILGTVAQSFLY